MRKSDERELVLKLLAASAFLVFFQTYLFAPLLPSLAREFGAGEAAVGWLIPAFMIPYGVSALVYGALGDRLGRKNILIGLLGSTSLVTLVTALSTSINSLLICRVWGGAACGGIIPISIALTGDLFPYRERGRPLGWIYSGMAGGAAFGASLGAYLNPIVGWRWELAAVGALNALIGATVWSRRSVFKDHSRSETKFIKTFASYLALLKLERGSRAYALIFFNSMFHSGVFSWLGQHLAQTYGLGDQGVGLALLGYGIPGMLFGPLIGKWADRTGRNVLIPLGLVLSALSAFGFARDLPLVWCTAAAALLSLGYDLTQPLLGGIITSLDARKRGQSISLSAFFLFVGFGLGPIVFHRLAAGDLRRGFVFFAAAELLICVLGAVALKNETARRSHELH